MFIGIIIILEKSGKLESLKSAAQTLLKWNFGKKTLIDPPKEWKSFLEFLFGKTLLN